MSQPSTAGAALSLPGRAGSRRAQPVQRLPDSHLSALYSLLRAEAEIETIVVPRGRAQVEANVRRRHSAAMRIAMRRMAVDQLGHRHPALLGRSAANSIEQFRMQG